MTEPSESERRSQTLNDVLKNIRDVLSPDGNKAAVVVVNVFVDNQVNIEVRKEE